MDVNEGLLPASLVIAKLGGIDATAALVERHRSVVNRWRLPKESGGTGGIVPATHQQTILNKAPDKVSPGDFFLGAAEPDAA